MLVGDIGEFDLIDRLESSVRDRSRTQIRRLEEYGVRVELGIGDDAAAWTYPDSTIVSTTDTMVEDVHFVTGKTPWRQLGWKALASNLSDIGAMGCVPTFGLVTLGLRADIEVNNLVKMYRGMMDVLAQTGGTLIGGDVVRSDTFFVSVALEGLSLTGAPVLRRDAAQVGDNIAVTGHLGCSAGGLRLMLGDDPHSNLQASTREHLLTAHNLPVPRVSEGVRVRQLGVRCAMDISDGLATDLTKICAASGVSAQVDSTLVPADVHLRTAFPDDWLGMALGGGEDYELVFTAEGATMDCVRKELGDLVTVIGVVTDTSDGVVVVDGGGEEISVGSTGWDHFPGSHG